MDFFIYTLDILLFQWHFPGFLFDTFQFLTKLIQKSQQKNQIDTMFNDE